MHLRMVSTFLLLVGMFALVTAVSADDVDDFDPDLDSSLWALIQNGTVASVPCGFVSSPNALQMHGGPPDKRIAAPLPGLDGSEPPRIAQTVPLDVSNGGSIEFDYIQPGTDSKRIRALGGSVCEGTTTEEEFIALEYSVNGRCKSCRWACSTTGGI